MASIQRVSSSLTLSSVAYLSVFAIQTVAYALFARQVPKSFFVASTLVISSIHIIKFDQAIFTHTPPEKLQRSMIVICSVISSIFFTMTFLPLLRYQDYFLKLNQRTLGLGLQALLIGTLVPAAIELFQKGFELSKLQNWKEMDEIQERYQKFQPYLETSSIFGERVRRFALLVSLPKSLRTSEIEPATFIMLSSALQEDYWKKRAQALSQISTVIESQHVLTIDDMLLEIPGITEEELQQQKTSLFNQYLHLFQLLRLLKPSSQIALHVEILPLLELYSSNLKPALSPEFNDFVSKTQIQLKDELLAKKKELDDSCCNLKANPQLDLLQTLQINLRTLIAKLETFLIERSEYQELIEMQSNILKEIAPNVKKETHTEIDLTDTPAAFFQMILPTDKVYPRLVQVFGITGNSDPDIFAKLEEKMTKLGIGTMEDFITKIMKGNREKFIRVIEFDEKNRMALLEKEVFSPLTTFIQPSPREKVYEFIAHHLNLTESGGFLAKTVYRCTMLFLTLAPVFESPHGALLGFSCRLIYQIPLVQTILNQEKLLLRLKHVLALTYSIASRRSLRTLFQETRELNKYMQSDLLGKCRLLGFELILGSFILGDRIPLTKTPIHLGGIVQGAAFAEELIPTLSSYRWSRVN